MDAASAAASTYTFPSRGDSGPITGTGAARGLCLTAPSTAVGTVLVMRACDGSTSQVFSYRDVSNGFVGTGVMLVPSGGQQGIGGYDLPGEMFITAAGNEDRFLLERAAPIAAATATARGSIADPVPFAGDTVTWTVVIENDGELALDDLIVEDAAGTRRPCAGALPVGGSVTCTSTGTLSQAQVDAGSVRDTFTVRSTTEEGDPYVLAPARAAVRLPPAATGTTTTSAAADDLRVGDDLDVVATAENTGNVTLSGLRASIGGQQSTCADTRLSPAASTSCTITHTVSQSDVDEGRIVFPTEATGTTPAGPTAALSPSEAVVTGTARPATELTLTTTSPDADEPGVGDPVGLRSTVRNTGNVTLDDLAVVVAEREEFRVDCPAEPLAPGATVPCSVTGTAAVTQADVDAGRITFAADSTAAAPAGTTVRAAATAERPTVGRAPAIDTAITAHLAETDHRAPVAGDTIVAHATVTNSGNTTLTAVVAVLGADSTLACTATVLVPGAVTDCTVPDHVLTQSDVDHGSVEFPLLATGVSAGPGPEGTIVLAEDAVSVTLDPDAALDLSGTWTPSRAGAPVDRSGPTDDVRGRSGTTVPGVVRAGDTIAGRYRVVNTSNVTVHSLALTDVRTGRVSCDTTDLVPGASTTCTGVEPVEVTSDQVEHGFVRFDAVATGATPSGAAVRSNEIDEAFRVAPTAAAPTAAVAALAFTGPIGLVTGASAALVLLAVGLGTTAVSRRRRN